ncbi:DNA methyltransferase [Candidatus Binatus sp.]|uniref:DNA methyltransferase n=1 Tax=Candidatus Binatus sp. TaxID=2811406 RepID=UPI002F93D8B1
MNRLYYGDNLEVLRKEIKDESVDLIYLDPPFNSQATYNVLFKAPTGEQSHAQIEAFEDTWHWGESAERAFDEVMSSGNTAASELLRALRTSLHENDMMAYLAMMAIRLLELHRVLKATGSLYLHCDPTASHYLKMLLDGIFNVSNYRNEIIWKRRVGMSSAVHESNRFGICTDTILFYAKSDSAQFRPQYNLDDPDYQRYIEERFTMVDEKGEQFQPTSLVNPAFRPNLIYEYKGYKPPPNGWMITKEKMTQWDKEGKIYFPKHPGRRLRRKSYAKELKGMPIQNLWTDIPEINSQAQERLGYPTQKPIALLARIIEASSDPGDVVLDPFCGCGTAIHAAQKLKRQWIGIDVTHLAISLVEKRLKDAFPGITYEVHGTPKDLDGARDLAARDKYQFQWWAVSLVNAVPFGGKKKGADTGIDGLIYFKDFRDGKITTEKAVVSVKGGENVSVSMIRDLAHVVDREKAKMGLFITLAEPTDPMGKEALKEGYFETSTGGKYLKLQISTIKELLAGKRPDLPSPDPGQFAKAEVEAKEQGKLL